MSLVSRSAATPSGGGGSVTTRQTPAQTVSAGNLLIAKMSHQNSGAPVLTDGSGGGIVWHQAIAPTNLLGGINWLSIYYAYNIAAAGAGSLTNLQVTATWGAASLYSNLVVEEFNNFGTVDPLMDVQGGSGNSALASTSSLTVSGGTHIISAICEADGDSGVFTSGTYTWSALSDLYFGTGYHSTSASEVASVTVNPGLWEIIAAAFKQSSPPSTPNSPSPSDTGTGITIVPTLTWSALGATTYDVKFGTSPTPSTVSSGQAGAAYAPGTLSNNTVYYWQIVAINGSGSTTGPVWSFRTIAAAIPTPTPTYKINGIDRTSIVKINSTKVNDSLGSRNTFEVTFWDFTVDVSIRPVVGQTVLVIDVDGVTPLFAGTINDIDETFVSNAVPYLEYVLHCVDYSQIMDRFLVAESYIDPTQTLSTIVLDIVANVLAGEGINTAGVQTGPVIPEMKIFNYKTATAVFNELTTLSGYPWWVDYSKVLYFVPRTGLPTSIVLSKSNSLSCKVKTSRSIGPYRNVQYVRAGTAETATRTDHTTGDGKRRTFDLKFDIARGAVKGTSPAITVNGSVQTVGRKGIDTGFQFYWITGSNQVIQDDTGTLLVSTDDLAVTYVGRYPSVVVSQRDAEVVSRQAVEGGTGVYMNLKVDYNLNDLTAQTNLANALLDRYGFIPQQLQVVTDVIGIRSGMLINCVFPENQVSGNFIVQSVTGNDMSGKFMRYTVTLVNG